MGALINFEQLEKLKTEEQVIIFDCRFSLMDKEYGVNSYKAGHIDGAYLINIEKDLTDEVGVCGGRHPFKKIADLKNTLEQFGVEKDSYVVIYDNGDLQGAGRMYYQLKNFGLKNIFVLDGGIASYKYFGGKISTEDTKLPNKKSNLEITLDDSFIVDVNYVREKLYDENTILVDSRSNPRYLGLEEPVDKIAGHIPSAKNYFFKDILVDENLITTSSFKDDNFLNNHFSTLDKNKEIIVYCGSGISLGVNALALDKLNIPYKIYPGSYSDWISYEDNDIATGEE